MIWLFRSCTPRMSKRCAGLLRTSNTVIIGARILKYLVPSYHAACTLCDGQWAQQQQLLGKSHNNMLPTGMIEILHLPSPALLQWYRVITDLAGALESQLAGSRYSLTGGPNSLLRATAIISIPAVTLFDTKCRNAASGKGRQRFRTGVARRASTPTMPFVEEMLQSPSGTQRVHSRFGCY